MVLCCMDGDFCKTRRIERTQARSKVCPGHFQFNGYLHQLGGVCVTAQVLDYASEFYFGVQTPEPTVGSFEYGE